MIEGVQGVNYESYMLVNTVQTSKVDMDEQSDEVFDIQQILKNLKTYTYSESDLESLDKNLVSEFKKKFNVSEEELWTLKKNGYDLERLYAGDVSYYNTARINSNTYQSDEKTSKITQISSKIDLIKKQNDHMYLYALYSKEPVTINSLYQNNFKGPFYKSNATYSSQDITKVLGMNGLDDTKGNRWAVGQLVEYGMPIHKTDVIKLQNIKAAVDALDEQEELQKAQEDLACNKESGERPLVEEEQRLYEDRDIQKIKEDLGQVVDGDIEDLVIGDEEITIQNLRAALFKNADRVLKPDQNIGVPSSQQNTITQVKEQIQQIRAKLTTHAAQKISEKMPLESAKLTEVVEALNRLENETIEEAVKEADIPLSDENIEIISNVMHVRQEILENRDKVLELEIETEEQVRLFEIHEALLKYHQNETVAEKRFGENIKIVEAQIEDVLQNQGIGVTNDNIQIAKALIINGMEINEENIASASSILLKLNTFIEEMTPTQTALLIKEGINPYEASIDTLMGSLIQNRGDVLKNSIAETIVSLQEQGIINEEQQEALIGFYRIMQTVAKHKDEVVGYLFKNNLPLTIEKLQEATRYIGNSNVIDTLIDDQFGEIDKLHYDAQTSKMMLEQSNKTIKKSLDVINVLENMELPINEENIGKLSKINALLYPVIKEHFKKELGKFEGMATLPQSFLEKLEAIKIMEPEVVQYMLKESISPTVSNLYWIDKIIKNSDTYKQVLSQGGLIKDELPKSLEDFEEELASQEEQAIQNKEVAVAKGDLLAYRTYKQIEEVVHLEKELSQKDGVYQIPFMIDGQEKMVHLYYNKKQNQQTTDDDFTTAVMTYDTEHLGTIAVYIRFQEDVISYKVQGETREVTNKLQKNNEALEQLLGQIGYGVKLSEYDTYQERESLAHQHPLIKRGESDFEEIV